MKQIFLLLLLPIGLYSCSKDDTEDSQDNSLLLGTWFEEDRCSLQSNILFNTDGTYSWTETKNPNCDTNEFFTVQTTGTYTKNGSTISFSQQTVDVLDLGSSGNPVDVSFVYQLLAEVTVLTENMLTFKITSVNEEPLNGNTYIFYK